MEYFECKLTADPFLLFDEEGFRFHLDGKSWAFHPHLWMDFGDSFSVRLRSKEAHSPTSSAPEVITGKVLYGIDRSLIHPERQFTFGKSLSEVIELFFRAMHEQMGNAFSGKTHLNVIRPTLFSRHPPEEGLAVVRMKSALFRSGFPEKQRWITPFEMIPESEGNLSYLTDAFSQFRLDQKEVGMARGERDAGMKLMPPLRALPLTDKKSPLIEEAKLSLELRSQLPFLKDWSYLKKIFPEEAHFFESPLSLTGEMPRDIALLNDPGTFHYQERHRALLLSNSRRLRFN
jgi:hypothetical protein